MTRSAFEKLLAIAGKRPEDISHASRPSGTVTDPVRRVTLPHLRCLATARDLTTGLRPIQPPRPQDHHGHGAESVGRPPEKRRMSPETGEGVPAAKTGHYDASTPPATLVAQQGSHCLLSPPRAPARATSGVDRSCVSTSPALVKPPHQRNKLQSPPNQGALGAQVNSGRNRSLRLSRDIEPDGRAQGGRPQAIRPDKPAGRSNVRPSADESRVAAVARRALRPYLLQGAVDRDEFKRILQRVVHGYRRRGVRILLNLDHSGSGNFLVKEPPPHSLPLSSPSPSPPALLP